MPIAPYRIHAVRYAHRACTSSEVFLGDRHDAPEIRELAGAPDLVVPGHDPLVLDRLTRVADGIVEL